MSNLMLKRRKKPPTIAKVSALLIAAVLSFASMLPSLAAEYPSDVSKWIEVHLPSASATVDRVVWSYAAGYSPSEWGVANDQNQIRATLVGRNDEPRGPRPDFIPVAENFRGGSAFAPVEDGWLVGFNHGEFGAALYWFSKDGKTSYKVSDHQVVDFIRRGNALYAIEGLAHMSLSRGSLIRISQPGPMRYWQAEEEVRLPFAPYAASLLADGTLLIVLSDALVAVTPDHRIRTLLANAPWNGLYPNSSTLAADQSKLYIGMRQFVGEYDLHEGTLRMLVPSIDSLNKLSAEQIRQVRTPFERAEKQIRKAD